MNAPSVLFEKEDIITTLTLNRPEKRNALSVALMKELCDLIAKTGKDPLQRIIIIRGTGEVFCAGLDLQEASEPRKSEITARMVARTLLALHQSPLITIAVVQGAAVAGGAGLMSACDFVIAAENAKIGFPETRRGLVAALVITLLRRQLRERDIRELLFTGDLISSERAREMGLVSRVVPTGNLMHEARKMIEAIIQGGPRALTNTKHALDESWPTSFKKDLDRAFKHHMKARRSKEAEEGIKAFLEKRRPRWTAA